MSTSHIGRAVAFINGTKNRTAREIAEAAGLHHTLLSRACNGARLEVKSLRALCTSQPDARDNIDLLIAHLRDEIERAGHSTTAIEITADEAQVDDELRVLLDEAKHDEQLRGMLRQLASFVRTHPLRAEDDETKWLAAEPAATYGKPKVNPSATDALEKARRAKAAPQTPPAAP